jgi:hypothetical protein
VDAFGEIYGTTCGDGCFGTRIPIRAIDYGKFHQLSLL